MPDPTIEDVDRDLTEATQHVADLEQAVIDGEDAVAPETIEKAKGRIGFLRLQRKGAEKRQTKRDEADREAATAEAYAQREEFYATGTAAAKEAYTALVDAARKFNAEWDSLREAHSEVGERAVNMGLTLTQDQTWLFDFGSYLGDDGFVRAALREAAGETLHRAHGLHDDAVRAGYTEREEAQQRWEQERQAAFEAKSTTHREDAHRIYV